MSGAWRRQIEDLVEELGGGEIDLTNGGHYSIKLFGVGLVVYVSSTPGDHRAFKNARALLRRALRRKP